MFDICIYWIKYARIQELIFHFTTIYSLILFIWRYCFYWKSRDISSPYSRNNFIKTISLILYYILYYISRWPSRFVLLSIVSTNNIFYKMKYMIYYSWLKIIWHVFLSIYSSTYSSWYEIVQRILKSFIHYFSFNVEIMKILLLYRISIIGP